MLEVTVDCNLLPVAGQVDSDMIPTARTQAVSSYMQIQFHLLFAVLLQVSTANGMPT